ncbi:AAA family ATPase [Nemania abortiva]|nr:AAA family ATPase [Nemania abortiva]
MISQAGIEKTATNPLVDFSGHVMSLQPASLAHGGHQEVKLLPDAQNSSAMTTGHPNYTELMDRITSLEAENMNLKSANEAATRIQNLYWIIQAKGIATAYLAEPTWSVGPNDEAILTAHFPITDVNGFLSGKHNISFVVSQYYRKEGQEKEVKAAMQAKQPLPLPKHHHETILLKSNIMIDAAEAFFAMQPKFAEEFPGLDIRAPLPAPYLFWYHYRSSDVSSQLNAYHQQQIQLLTSWIDSNYGAQYDLVDRQLADGVVSVEAMPFLVKPGDVLVWEAKGESHATIAKSWATRAGHFEIPAQDQMEYMERTKENDSAFQSISTWSVDSWSYTYDGRFLRKQRCVDIILKLKLPSDQVPIHNLSAYPLRFAKPRLATILKKRGSIFWKCRRQRFVSYNDEKDANEASERYMVDFETYKQLHSDSENYQKMYPDGDADSDADINNPASKYMGPTEMGANDPPPAPQIYAFPNTIPGYNMRSKKWGKTWNKQSFDHLVVDNETKELVQALVMHQIAREKGTDIIERKGNGLIILLHGGPGTGKTFTAESVAELAEKPLFRVTCGDIGTEPEKVEKYLESALYLGKVWGCVVLIDEAEVFLEQRSLDNLERNALVSVFLRVLEYYEGILILTSNRVGTFDEAFKSRILLSLHYDNLSLGQRTKIWKNFFSRLKTMDLDGSAKAGPSEPSNLSRPRKRKFEEVETGIDFDDVECYLGELAAYELNGRQIRNVITAARQYANFKGVAMNHEHLKHVIGVSSKFEKYLKTVQEGYTGDEIMRSDGIR